MQFIADLFKQVASVDAQTPEGQMCLKELSDHLKGMGTAIDRYRRARLLAAADSSATMTLPARGTAPGKINTVAA